MPFKRIRRKVKKLAIAFFQSFNYALIIICILVGYLIVFMNNRDRDKNEELTAAPSIIKDADKYEGLKQKIKDNPDLLKKFQ